MINVADFTDPNDALGRTYRQVNASRTHAIALHELVELKSGVRLFVVLQGRDCDETPLYWLAGTVDAPRDQWDGGYLEESLTVIEMATAQGIEPRTR